MGMEIIKISSCLSWVWDNTKSAIQVSKMSTLFFLHANPLDKAIG